MSTVTVSAAIDLVIALLDNAQKISQLVQAAQAAGQTTLPADAWQTIVSSDDTAEGSLAAAIKAAGG